MKKISILILMILTLGTVFAAPWDSLKIIPDIAVQLNLVVEWLLVIVSLLVLSISAIALKKTKSQKLAFVTIAFGLFFLKSVLNLIDIYFSPGFFMNFAVQGLFDLLIIASLFIALFRK